jgi:hypothetical protein
MGDRRSGPSRPSSPEGSPARVGLRPGPDRAREIEAVATSLCATGGGRLRLSEVLGDLNRSASVVRVPASAAQWGFRWDDEDSRSQRWWPQGVTTSADHDEGELYDGRRVALTSWYAKELEGLHKGSRITVVDLERLRYRHVLLVEAYTRDDGSVDVRPLRVHAGGIVWHGRYLHVAATARGIRTFALDDLIRVGDLGDQDRLAVTVGSFGYRYLLPAQFGYDACREAGEEPVRYSFLSLGRGRAGAHLVAGEYGRGRATTRLLTFPIDPATSLLQTSADGAVRPLSTARGVEGMQGATVVDERWYVSTSAGRYRRGSLYVGAAGAFRRRARVLPIGVEDLAYWPSRDELWSLSEYPGRRQVFTMDRARLG